MLSFCVSYFSFGKLTGVGTENQQNHDFLIFLEFSINFQLYKITKNSEKVGNWWKIKKKWKTPLKTFQILNIVEKHFNFIFLVN